MFLSAPPSSSSSDTCLGTVANLRRSFQSAAAVAALGIGLVAAPEAFAVPFEVFFEGEALAGDPDTRFGIGETLAMQANTEFGVPLLSLGGGGSVLSLAPPSPVATVELGDPAAIVLENDVSAMTNAASSTWTLTYDCLLYTSPSPRDQRGSRMPSSA